MVLATKMAAYSCMSFKPTNEHNLFKHIYSTLFTKTSVPALQGCKCHQLKKQKLTWKTVWKLIEKKNGWSKRCLSNVIDCQPMPSQSCNTGVQHNKRLDALWIHIDYLKKKRKKKKVAEQCQIDYTERSSVQNMLS